MANTLPIYGMKSGPGVGGVSLSKSRHVYSNLLAHSLLRLQRLTQRLHFLERVVRTSTGVHPKDISVSANGH